MNLVEKANSLATKLLNRDNVVAVYKDMVDQCNKKHKTVFTQQMHVYITKIGIILSECSAKSKIRANTYLGSIDFICLNLLKNKQLHKMMKNFINDDDNIVKHSINDLEVSIDTIVEQYNLFINEIIKSTNLKAFYVCLITKKKSIRDVPIINEEKHHKYFMIKNFKFQLKICPNYTIDKYTKKITSKLTLYWPEIAKNHYVEINVSNSKNKRIMCAKKQIDLGQCINKNQKDGKFVLPLNCSEEDLDRRVLSLNVEIILRKKTTKTHYFETGILFWKKVQSYDFDNIEDIGKYSCEMSQFFKP